TAPADGTLGPGPDLTLSWEEAAAAATSFRYSLDTTDDDACASRVDVGAGQSVALVGLAGGTTYFGQVRAVNGWGAAEADGGAWWEFTTGPPAAFDKAAPADGAQGQSANLTLSWGAAAGATSYEYCADTSDDAVCGGWAPVGPAATAYLEGLAYETTHYWQVRAVNPFGMTEADGGTWWSFRTKPPPEIEQVVFEATGVNDGWVLERIGDSGKGSGALDDASPRGRVGDDDADRQYRSLLDFDTRGLPDDAVVTACVLRIRRAEMVGTDPLTTHGVLQVDIRTGAFHHELALERFDFHAIGSRGRVGKFVVTPDGEWLRASLRPVAVPLVNLTGRTQFRLRFQLDDDDDQEADYLSFFTGDAADPADRPQLTVRYYVP
ncbi:MAG: hypothetical protein MUE66_05895, partial [Acidimicrobiia bacterium]|nr:hypothetical protein [Acidimicrobiia bacterium]